MAFTKDEVRLFSYDGWNFIELEEIANQDINITNMLNVRSYNFEESPIIGEQ